MFVYLYVTSIFDRHNRKILPKVKAIKIELNTMLKQLVL
jgi:hypothetical protein